MGGGGKEVEERVRQLFLTKLRQSLERRRILEAHNIFLEVKSFIPKIWFSDERTVQRRADAAK